MASDDELKDEELVDFEGSDYDIDGDYEEVEEEEEEEEEEEKEEEEEQEVVAEEAPDLVRREHHDQPDAAALHSGSNGVLATPRIPAFGSSKFTESSAFGGSEPLNSSASGALETLKDSKKTALEVAEPLEPLERGANGASQCEEATEVDIAGSILVVTSMRKASEITCPVASTDMESSCTRSPENAKKGMEIEGIPVAQKQRDGNDISGPAPSMRSDASGAHCTSEHEEGRPGLPSSKPDLEDGELDETAVPQNYGLNAEEEVNDEMSGREKKRKKEGSGSERHMDGSESYNIKQAEETGHIAGKQHHSLGSDKAMEHFAGLACAGGRGMGVRIIGLGQGSLAPGIMGPGRPLMPIVGGFAQGFNPFGGITPHGRPQVHLQEVLAQEHLLRAHALQLAQETLANAIRSPLTRPLGAAGFQPFMGYDVHGLRSHAPKHFPRPSPDLILGPMGSFARGQRPNLPAGRAGLSGKVGGQADTNLYSGMGRQFGWPAASGSNELQTLKRGRGRGRGFRTGLWGDAAESFVPMSGGLGSAGHPRAMMNAGAPPSIRHLNPDDSVFYQTSLGTSQAESDLLHNGFDARWTSLGTSQAESDLLHNGFDARWKIEKERMLRNGSPHLRVSDNAMVGGSLSEGGREFVKDSGKFGEVKPQRSQDSFKTGNLAARLGPPAQAKAPRSINADSSDSAVSSNVIKLHQPVRKSRILTVSGLPEDTPISAVVEVFEKLGKITDFKKSTKGDTFTISYSSETEAVTAKRNLHRSCLAGKQITVDYAHQ